MGIIIDKIFLTVESVCRRRNHKINSPRPYLTLAFMFHNLLRSISLAYRGDCIEPIITRFTALNPKHNSLSCMLGAYNLQSQPFNLQRLQDSTFHPMRISSWFELALSTRSLCIVMRSICMVFDIQSSHSKGSGPALRDLTSCMKATGRRCEAQIIHYIPPTLNVHASLTTGLCADSIFSFFSRRFRHCHHCFALGALETRSFLLISRLLSFNVPHAQQAGLFNLLTTLIPSHVKSTTPTR